MTGEKQGRGSVREGPGKKGSEAGKRDVTKGEKRPGRKIQKEESELSQATPHNKRDPQAPNNKL